MVALLAAAFPRPSIEEPTIAVYLDRLSDVDPADLYEAVARLVDTSVRLPTIAEIRRSVAESALHLPTPAEALEIVSEAVEKNGMTSRLDPGGFIRKAWRAINGDQQAFYGDGNAGVWRGEFLKVYAQLRETAITAAMWRRP